MRATCWAATLGLLLSFAGLLPSTTWAAGPRVLAAGQQPADSRLAPLTKYADYFPAAPTTDTEVWQKRADYLRRRAKVALGLWPVPTPTDSQAVVHGLVDRDDYTVERVYLQTMPGNYLSGSLYRPKGFSGKRPLVLVPHGHWQQGDDYSGRFYQHTEKQAADNLANGAEKFTPSGLYPLQARCAQMARMGCVVFHYDMIGYGDNRQFVHRPGSRDPLNTRENWGYFSPQAELRLQTTCGLQTYNSVRALDWALTLPEVDPTRICVNGSSGGGSQTLFLSLVDDRPTVVVPAVIISTSMQGGCTCENASYLRVDTGNIELASTVAPKPLGMTTADDWTIEMATKGFPEIKALYNALGVGDRVALWEFPKYRHNYNYPSRAPLYVWLNQWFELGLSPEQLIERDFVPLTKEELTVWNAEHPQPQPDDDQERAMLRWLTEVTKQQLDALVPTDSASHAKWREVIGGAFDILVGRPVPDTSDVRFSRSSSRGWQNYNEFTGQLKTTSRGEAVPMILLQPKEWNKQVVVWVDEQGKSALYNDDGTPQENVAKLLDQGFAVVGIDLFGQGEFTADGQPLQKNALNANGRGNWQHYAGYTYGYNHSLFARRTHDLLGLVAMLRADSQKPEQVHLVGLGRAGLWVAAARAQLGPLVDKVVVDTQGFRFEQIESIDDGMFWPGVVKYGDVPALLALSAPYAVSVLGEPQLPELTKAVYQAAGAEQKAVVHGSAEEALRWLTNE